MPITEIQEEAIKSLGYYYEILGPIPNTGRKRYQEIISTTESQINKFWGAPIQIFLLDSLKNFSFQPLNFWIQLTLTVLYNDLGETFTTSQCLSKNNPENKISLQSSVTPTLSHSKSLIHTHPQMRGRKVYPQKISADYDPKLLYPSGEGLAAS